MSHELLQHVTPATTSSPPQPHPEVVAALFMLCSQVALHEGTSGQCHTIIKADVAHLLPAGQGRAVPYSIPTMLPVLPSALLRCNKPQF